MTMLEVVSAVLIVAYLFYKYLTINNNYWIEKEIPALKPKLALGNIGDILFQKIGEGEFAQRIYRKFKIYKYVGFFNFRQPALFVCDPDLIKKILVDDFNSFHDNEFYLDETADPIMGKNVFILRGERWSKYRSKLSPAFTPTKMKGLFPLIMEVNDRLVQYITNNLRTKSRYGLEAKDLSLRYTVDVVVLTSLGIEAGSFENPNTEFKKMSHKIMQDESFLGGLKFFIMILWPSLAKSLKLKIVTKEIECFFTKVIEDAIAYRKKNNIKRHDFLEFLLENLTDDGLINHDILSYIVTYFIEGSETSSNTLGFALYELAANPLVYRKLREEIDDVLYEFKGQFCYEALQKMTYLDCILSETLRKDPPAFNMRKICTKPYKLSHPKNGLPDYEIPVGTSIMIPVYSISNDPEYFVAPDTFDPDRFNEDRKLFIRKNTVFPFSQGPRQCIGMRLAQLQVKMAIVTIVRNFDVRINAKTKTPLEVDPTSFMHKVKGGIWLDFCKKQ